jgi:hypothetical protein
MAQVKMPLAIAAVYLWIGFVCAISFIEAWLKFRAPGVTLPVGLGIGRLVFNALNKAEWIFVLAIIVSFFLSKENLLSAANFTLFIPVILLILQTLWLLPALDARAELHIQGMDVPASNNHIYYVTMEVVKVICLIIFSIKLFK